MKVLGIVPARGGSKGVPRKNLRKIGGRSLLEWAITCGSLAETVTHVIVSTDDAEIAETALGLGASVPFLRPSALSTDSANSVDVALHALDHFPEFEVVVLLQPTSPFRTPQDVDAVVQLLKQHSAPAAVSVCEAPAHPQHLFYPNGVALKRAFSGDAASRRQDLPLVYALNGAVYVIHSTVLQRYRTFVPDETVAYIMPKSRSVDIDSEWDLELAQMIFGSIIQQAELSDRQKIQNGQEA